MGKDLYKQQAKNAAAASSKSKKEASKDFSKFADDSSEEGGKFKYDKSFYEEDKFQGADDDDEVATGSGFDLRGKSLANTERKKAEAKKEVLPLKAIMKDILEKQQQAQDAAPVGKSSSSIVKGVVFSKKKVIVKNVVKAKKNAKLEAIKSYLKKKNQKVGKVLPNYAREREYERNLKMIAVEGSKVMINSSYEAVQRYY